MQRADISLGQFSLEGGSLQDELAWWALRQPGAYVAPRFYNTARPRRPEGQVRAHNFALTLPPPDIASDIKDGDKVTLRRYDIKIFKSDKRNFYGLYNEVLQRVPGEFTARAMVARPLTHLTIRM